MRYFIEDIKTYKSVNKKGLALQDFVTPLEQYLVADELSLDALKANIENHIVQLNCVYPRSRPLVMDESRGRGYRVWTVCVQGDSDKIAALIYIKEVRGDIHFSVHDPLPAANAPERHAQSSAK